MENAPFDLMDMFRQMADPSTCINCGKPLEEGDQGVDGVLPGSKICTPCNRAHLGMMYDMYQGIEVTYRDGTTERIGG